jgi:hypothetical protein
MDNPLQQRGYRPSAGPGLCRIRVVVLEYAVAPAYQVEKTSYMRRPIGPEAQPPSSRSAAPTC